MAVDKQFIKFMKKHKAWDWYKVWVTDWEDYLYRNHHSLFLQHKKAVNLWYEQDWYEGIANIELDKLWQKEMKNEKD